MFIGVLLNVLLDLTEKLDVLCRSFATQNISASLYSILTYQINFLHPTPTINFQFSNASHPFISIPPSIRHSKVD